ncbi:MAG TPA: VIT1/CCC1 transporter family protein [Candidatus Saccharimonadales bacterium]|nr:VIT1/CCC1 transporter family protein [Candidatus Saccharimonadales bacterium]
MVPFQWVERRLPGEDGRRIIAFVTNDVVRWRANLQGEVDGATAYRAMAEAEHDGPLATVYQHLAQTEERHASLWETKLRAAGAWTGMPRPSWRARILAAVARRFGAGAIAATMGGRETRDQGTYDDQPEASGTSLPRDERSHARLLREIAGSGITGPGIASLEGRHRTGGNALRAAVLGVDDGLVSNFCLVMGIAGATSDSRTIALAGVAGILAGSISMALGEWLSVQSTRELFARQIGIETEELAAAPQEEEEELTLIYQSKGVAAEQARAIAGQLVHGDAKAAVDALAREELGIDPHDLGGSAWVAAGTSFAMFATGALVPLVPFAFTTGTPAIVVAAVLSALALFGVGALITVITGQSALRAGLRQLAIGIVAAAVTYGIGKALGTAIT